MKRIVIAIFTLPVALATFVPAQDLVEYSHAATQAAKSLSTGMARIASPTDTVSSAESSKRAAVWEAKKTSDAPPALAKPAPPAVFVLSSGERLESSNYLVTAQSIRLDTHGVQRTIPMNRINVNATVAANRQRGIDLKIPTDKSEITLGF